MRFAVATMRSLAHRSRFAAAAAAAASFGTVVGGVTMLESARTPLPLARVVSYNVLSSHLCGADHYNMCKPEDLDPPTRRKRVEALLMEHMDKQAVICLQEVSVQWVGELTPFFERAGYTANPHPHPSPYLSPNPNPNPNQVRATLSSRGTTATPSMATWVPASRG
jgi:2',5'-phosphodiesterase